MPIDREGNSSHSVTAALNAAGVGRFQWWLLGYTGLAWAGDACETMLLSYLGPSVACFWPDIVGPFQERLLTSVVFFGMMIGVTTLGMTADVLGRRKGFFLSASILGIAGVASAAAPSFTILLLLRTIVGAALGGTPIAVTLFSEFLPTSRRGSLVLLLQAAWSVGTVFEAVLAWLILPRLGWRWLLTLSALPMGILLIGYPWLPESPHWLAAQGRMKEAEQVVARVARVNNIHTGNISNNNNNNNNNNFDSQDVSTAAASHPTTTAAAATTINHLPSSRNHRASPSHQHLHTTTNTTSTITNSTSTNTNLKLWSPGSLRDVAKDTLSKVFSPKLAKTTSLLWAIWFVNALTYYGLVLLTTSIQASSPRNNNNKNNIDTQMLVNTTMTSSGSGGSLGASASSVLNFKNDGDSGQSRCTADGKPNFTASDYLAVLITSAAEAPGLLVAALFIDGKGRVWCLRAGLLLCSACVLSLIAFSTPGDSASSSSMSSWWSSSIQLALLFIARASIEASFSVLYVYTPELYSTSIRAQGLALCNAFSRLGGFVAPFATVYLVESGRTGAAEGLLGVLLLVAAAAAMALPFETKGIDLGEDIVEIYEGGGFSPSSSILVEEERERLVSEQGLVEVHVASS